MTLASKDTALASLREAFAQHTWFLGAVAGHRNDKDVLVVTTSRRTREVPTEWRGYPVVIELETTTDDDA
ncbi:MAG: hypothetical protein H6733_05000 [Alphaproteobacteria bacterium]|nr:hypothetical protein [Alphaproteobacteria bacterium]